MENNKGSVVLSVILTVLVVGLVGYIVYDKVAAPKNEGSLNTETKERLWCLFKKVNISLNNNEVVKTYSYSSIKGAYKSQSTSQACGEGSIENYSMKLYENGLFEITANSGCSSSETIGNYIIEGNKIILNELFYRDGKYGDINTHKSYTFVINSDGSLSGTYINNKEIFVNDPNGKLSSSGSPLIAEAGNYTLQLDDFDNSGNYIY